MESSKAKVTPAARRGFLLGAGAAGAAGAVAAVVVRAPGVPANVVAGGDAGASAQGRGYRLTEHVRKYYDTTTV